METRGRVGGKLHPFRKSGNRFRIEPIGALAPNMLIYHAGNSTFTWAEVIIRVISSIGATKQMLSHITL